jgi:hypothetical protein
MEPHADTSWATEQPGDRSPGCGLQIGSVLFDAARLLTRISVVLIAILRLVATFVNGVHRLVQAL